MGNRTPLSLDDPSPPHSVTSRSTEGIFVADGSSQCPEGPCCAAGSATSCWEAGGCSSARRSRPRLSLGFPRAPLCSLEASGAIAGKWKTGCRLQCFACWLRVHRAWTSSGGLAGWAYRAWSSTTWTRLPMLRHSRYWVRRIESSGVAGQRARGCRFLSWRAMPSATDP